ncbi:MAG TPA: NIPSNAP family protein [Parafilimonas sp.]|nr:NIPSNAP family protein [Parafilimonas sp.]
MNRKIVLLVITAILLIPAKNFANEIYVITAYHFNNAQQEIRLDTYLQTAYLPAMHRKNKMHIGVFKPITNDTSADKIIYVIVPYKTLDEIQLLDKSLLQDSVYLQAGSDYINAAYNNPAYTRMEKIVLNAFDLAPQMKLPKLDSNKQDHIYELRSYESATEAYHRNKVQMFNAGGEIDIFKRLNFNPVFYADVIVGSHMPNLMYLTSYENMDDRNAHWKSFGDDPAWKKVSGMSEYQNNVSHIDDILMHATPYSDY